MVTTTLNIIDSLGVIDKQIKELEESARRLKKELIAKGVGKYEGDSFVAEVQHYTKSIISPKLVRELADEDFVNLVTQVQEVDAVVVRSL